MMPATILAIEGPDRVGKQTQSQMLVEALRSDFHRVKLVEVPVRSWVTYKLIYWMLRGGLAKTFPNAFQFVQFLNKWIFQLKLLVFRWFYDYIVFDRWALSSIVYGDAGGANKRFNRFLYKFLREPDVTLILVGAPRTTDEGTDVYERDNPMQNRVRVGYADWYASVPADTKIALLDNTGSRPEVHQRFMRALENFGAL